MHHEKRDRSLRHAANEQELEAAWNNLSAEEQRVFEQLMEEDSPEDALAFFAQLYDDAPKEQASETVSISENEIYFKRQPLTEEQKKHGSYVDENGNLHVKNLSAFWIPELTTTEKVGHTTYTVTGSYEGKESFLKKLERIVAKNAQQKFEDEGAGRMTTASNSAILDPVTNPVLTVAPQNKEDTTMSGATNKITALYCRLSQEDARLGESLSLRTRRSSFWNTPKRTTSRTRCSCG